jgi:NAD(P)-dependent dehydrogenase (short-subunit alcohol dehydrogenase family)
MTQELSAAAAVADKLHTEGERSIAFFTALSDAQWAAQLYTNGACWTVAQTFEHLIMAERLLFKMIARVADGGPGAPEDLDIDDTNLSMTGALGSLERQTLLRAYSETRAATVALARSLDATQLARRGRHPAMGDSSVEDMLKMVYLHNTLHIKDIKRMPPAS